MKKIKRDIIMRYGLGERVEDIARMYGIKVGKVVKIVGKRG